LNEIRIWTEWLSAENDSGFGPWRQSETQTVFVATEPFTRALEKLKIMKGGQFTLIGPQGSGKSATLRELYTNLNAAQQPTMLMPWRSLDDLFTEIKEGRCQAYFPTAEGELSRYDFIATYVEHLLSSLQSKHRFSKSSNPPPTIYDAWKWNFAERKLGQTEVTDARLQSWLYLMTKVRTLLIDLPDYATSDQRHIARDLEQISASWLATKRYTIYHPNIVIAIPMSAVGKHQFLGKTDQTYLRPLTSTELLNSYFSRFGTKYPFTESALLLIGSLCQGIFRRFKRYVGVIVERWSQEPDPRSPVDSVFVQRTLMKQVLVDLELDLSKIFPRQPEHRTVGSAILAHLQEHGPTEQAVLRKELRIRDYTLSRVLRQLEPQFVTQSRDGQKKIVRLTGIQPGWQP
jgi:GTPase SAR1 family protein